MCLKMSSAKWWPFCPGGDGLKHGQFLLSTPHNSPTRARLGVSVVSLKCDLHSTCIIAVLFHWKLINVTMPTLSSLFATYDATSEDKVGIMTTLRCNVRYNMVEICIMIQNFVTMSPTYIVAWQYIILNSKKLSILYVLHIDGLVQDCSNSSASAIELLQSCTKQMAPSHRYHNTYAYRDECIQICSISWVMHISRVFAGRIL